MHVFSSHTSHGWVMLWKAVSSMRQIILYYRFQSVKQMSIWTSSGNEALVVKTRNVSLLQIPQRAEQHCWQSARCIASSTCSSQQLKQVLHLENSTICQVQQCMQSTVCPSGSSFLAISFFHLCWSIALLFLQLLLFLMAAKAPSQGSLHLGM